MPARRNWHFWRPFEGQRFHVECHGARTVCGLKVKRAGSASAYGEKPPGALCANCDRMKAADTIRAL